jgi:uncharacterized protein (DUF305 family)
MERLALSQVPISIFENHIKYLEEQLKLHPEDADFIQEAIEHDQLIIDMRKHPENKAADQARLKALGQEMEVVERTNPRTWARYMDYTKV